MDTLAVLGYLSSESPDLGGGQKLAFRATSSIGSFLLLPRKPRDPGRLSGGSPWPLPPKPCVAELGRELCMQFWVAKLCLASWLPSAGFKDLTNQRAGPGDAPLGQGPGNSRGC